LLYFIKNGFIFAIPYIAQFLITIVVGRIVDRMRIRKTFSITTLRKGQAVIGKTKILIPITTKIFIFQVLLLHVHF
jgi:hypothetical protein